MSTKKAKNARYGVLVKLHGLGCFQTLGRAGAFRHLNQQPNHKSGAKTRREGRRGACFLGNPVENTGLSDPTTGLACQDAHRTPCDGCRSCPRAGLDAQESGWLTGSSQETEKAPARIVFGGAGTKGKYSHWGRGEKKPYHVARSCQVAPRHHPHWQRWRNVVGLG